MSFCVRARVWCLHVRVGRRENKNRNERKDKGEGLRRQVNRSKFGFGFGLKFNPTICLNYNRYMNCLVTHKSLLLLGKQIIFL